MKKIKYSIASVIILMAFFNNILQADGIKIPVCFKTENSFFPVSEKSFISGKYDGTLISWLEESNNGSLWIQKIDVTGRALWARNGVLTDIDLSSGFTEDSDYPYIFSDNEGGAVIIYRKKSIDREDIYMQRVYFNSEHLPLPVCISSHFGGYNYSPSAVLTKDNKIVITWENYSDGDFDIHAQKIDMDGNKLWNGERGVEVCNMDFDQRKPVISCSESGNVFIAWLDGRNFSEYRFDLFANMLNSNGEAISFSDKGKLIFRNEGSDNLRKISFYNHNAVYSEKSSFILALENSYDNQYSSVYVIKVNENLDMEWDLDLPSRSFQKNPLITGTAQGGACVIWNDISSKHNEVYGIVTDKNGNIILDKRDDSKISNDESKDIFYKTISSEKNQNGLHTYKNEFYVNWVTTNTNKLFSTSFSLADESKQCKKALEIHNNVSEGEYTSVTAHDNNIVTVYKLSNYIFASIRNTTTSDFKKSKQKSKLENYPNPFNPSTRIYFNIPSDGFVRLSVFDNTGRLVNTLIDDYRIAGEYKISFDGSDYSSGIYFYRLESNGIVNTNRMIMIK